MFKAGGPRIFISAGEPSGDAHGAPVVSALRERFPDAQIDALGGPELRAAGANVLYPMENYTVLGFVEIVGKIPAHYRLLQKLRAAFHARAYDLVILIDYPGFHVRVGEAARRAGIKVLYYIAPQLWAWRPGRAARLARAVDRLAVILPFEQTFFRGVHIEAEYVGHPLLDRGPQPGRSAARAALNISPEERVLAVFPGSRHQEILRHWDIFLRVALQLLAEKRCDRVLVAGTPQGQYPDAGPAQVVRQDPSLVFAAADAVLAKSGTTTLEAALSDTPMVVAYRTHLITSFIARRLMTVRWISLVNLVAEAPVVPEFLQEGMEPATLAAAVAPLLDPAHPITVAQRRGLAEVRRRLGAPGAAGRVVQLAAELLGG